MAILTEIHEQPGRLAQLLKNQRSVVEQIAAEIQQHDIRFVFLVARGSSDNAGRYANYLWGAQNKLPVALATPSLFTHYKNLVMTFPVTLTTERALVMFGGFKTNSTTTLMMDLISTQMTQQD